MHNNLLDNEKDNFNFNGFYRGVVMDNNDPKKNGAIKVKVYPMFKDIVTDDLPWAILADSFMGGSANVGGIFVPDVDAHVFVFFENGDWRTPVYFAGAPAISGGTPDVPTASRTGTTYPNNKVYRSKSGIQIELDDTPGAVRLKIAHPAGTNKTVDNAGAVVENVATSATINITTTGTIDIGTDLAITVGGDTAITTTGKTDIISTGNVKVQSSGTADVISTGKTTVTAPTTDIISATAVNITTPLCTVSGLLSCAGLGVGATPVSGKGVIDGDLDLSNGSFTVTTGDVVADGVSLKGHTHAENGDGGGETDPPT